MTEKDTVEPEEAPKPKGGPKGTVRVIVMAQNGVWLGNPPRRRAFGEELHIPDKEAASVADGVLKVIK